MDAIFVFEQLLNGLGYGLMLFLIAAGLTLVFGIMDTMNLAHGSLYMAGAYVAARVHEASGAFALAVLVAVGVTVAIAAVAEFLVIRRLYRRDHLVQVLATFGIILIADDAVKAIWGVAPLLASTPAALAGPVALLEGLPYPSYRLLLIGAGLTVALGLHLLVNKTRIGMLVRAGASNRQMAEHMGVRSETEISGYRAAEHHAGREPASEREHVWDHAHDRILRQDRPMPTLPSSFSLVIRCFLPPMMVLRAKNFGHFVPSSLKLPLLAENCFPGWITLPMSFPMGLLQPQ